MTDQMREMIAQLMGSQHVEDGGKPEIPYDHPGVCRAYLLGVCPHDLVPDSRLQSMVSCRKVHEPAHKADFERAQKERDHFYDIDAFNILEFAVRQVDGEIARIRDKLERDVQNQTSIMADSKASKIAEIEATIQLQLEEIEKLGNEGRIEESMKLSRSVEEMRDRIAEIEAQNDVKMAGPGSNAAKLRVCEECGAQLNITDHETRIADHYNGKMHLGMVETRETYKKMLETIEQRKKERDEKLGDRSNSYRYSSSRSNRDRRDYRDRDHDRRDRDRDRKRSRSRDRSRRNDKNGRYRDDRDRRDRNRDRDRRH
ncbi:unnamed protein product [Caenorhabditis bovis]|uniref:Uncharacterized protein n=1 Tax=Caenorhabditis bovis TaxID=2654633 RepID=A0A8S1F2C1_9PELO|nr:unnamed protein product [Caenorhabditis bovis]